MAPEFGDGSNPVNKWPKDVGGAPIIQCVPRGNSTKFNFTIGRILRFIPGKYLGGTKILFRRQR